MARIGTSLAEAKAFLEQGELVGIPTETVYGLAANALDERAVLSIFQAKKRPAFDPLIVHTHSVDQVPLFASKVPEAAHQLAEAFWPGPLTLLLPKQAIIPDLVTSGLDTVAVRVPDHPLTLELLRALDFPLAAPSANPFGYISPTTARHVAEQLGEQVPYILDGGECGVGIESTIVGFPQEGLPDEVPIVYRLGGLSVDEIEDVIGPVRLLPHSSSNPQAPGMLKSHYAPRKPLELVPREAMPQVPQDGYLLFTKYLDEVPTHNQRVLAPSGSLSEAAHHLFAYLRELDALPVGRIWAEPVPDEGLGRAINDRLRRAAAR